MEIEKENFKDQEIMMDHEREFLEDVFSISREDLVYNMTPMQTLSLLRKLAIKAREGYVHRKMYDNLMMSSIKHSEKMMGNVLDALLMKPTAEVKANQ